MSTIKAIEFRLRSTAYARCMRHHAKEIQRMASLQPLEFDEVMTLLRDTESGAQVECEACQKSGMSPPYPLATLSPPHRSVQRVVFLDCGHESVVAVAIDSRAAGQLDILHVGDAFACSSCSVDNAKKLEETGAIDIDHAQKVYEDSMHKHREEAGLTLREHGFPKSPTTVEIPIAPPPADAPPEDDKKPTIH